MPTPSLSIDLVPMCLAMCALVSAACCILAWRFRAGPAHLGHWAVAGLLISLAMLLIVLRGTISDTFSILLANVALIAGYGYLTAGTRVMNGEGLAGVFPVGLVAATLFLSAYMLDADLPARAAIVSAAILAYALMMLVVFVRRARTSDNPVLKLAVLALACTAFQAVLRMLLNLGIVPDVGPPPGLDLLVIGGGIVITLGMAVTLLAMAVPLALPGLRGVLGQALEFEPAETLRPSDRGWALLPEQTALVTPEGAVLKLTGNEFLVMQRLAAPSEDGPVPRTVLNSLIGRQSDNPKDRAIDILISRLRRKCSDAGSDLPVASVRGQGYLFNGEIAGTSPRA